MGFGQKNLPNFRVPILAPKLGFRTYLLRGVEIKTAKTFNMVYDSVSY